jgi:F0F1-type ATP synthase gamma subunit
MTGHRQLEDRLRAWRSFRGVARATRTLAASQALRWGEHVTRAEAHRAWCAELRRAYAPAEVTGPTVDVLVAIGSDHGLCGPLNRLVAEALAAALAAKPELVIVVGSRVSGYLDLGAAVRLPAPSSVPQTREVSTRIEGLIAAKGPLDRARVSIVSPTSVRPDGAVTVTSYDIEGVPAKVELPPAFAARSPVELSPRELAWPQVSALFLHAALIEALCRAGRCEAEARWRTMSRAHDAAERRIEEHSLHLRRLRQEGTTQEMLEARQGQGMRWGARRGASG